MLILYCKKQKKKKKEKNINAEEKAGCYENMQHGPSTLLKEVTSRSTRGQPLDQGAEKQKTTQSALLRNKSEGFH